jgi:hypothetical protein
VLSAVHKYNGNGTLSFCTRPGNGTAEKVVGVSVPGASEDIVRRIVGLGAAP